MAADSILGGGAMARSWSSYLAVMCNRPSTFFQIPFHGFHLDFMAVAAVAVVTAILVLGSKHMAIVNGGAPLCTMGFCSTSVRTALLVGLVALPSLICSGPSWPPCVPVQTPGMSALIFLKTSDVSEVFKNRSFIRGSTLLVALRTTYHENPKILPSHLQSVHQSPAAAIVHLQLRQHTGQSQGPKPMTIGWNWMFPESQLAKCLMVISWYAKPASSVQRSVCALLEPCSPRRPAPQPNDL